MSEATARELAPGGSDRRPIAGVQPEHAGQREDDVDPGGAADHLLELRLRRVIAAGAAGAG